VLLLHIWKGIPIRTLTADPTAIAGAPIYTGFLSQTGIFFWSATAAVCLFSANVLSRSGDNVEIKRFFVVSGMLTLVLGLDDVFLLHEEFFPRFGVPEKVVFMIYAGFVLSYLVGFYSTILNTEWLLLGMALTFFGVSIILDLFEPPGIDPFLIEDGAKLMGILSWLAYFFRTGVSAVSRNASR
jgi:hypothetical protein